MTVKPTARRPLMRIRTEANEVFRVDARSVCSRICLS